MADASMLEDRFETQVPSQVSLRYKRQGNIALGRALAYFASQGYGIFLPVADDGGAIDMLITPDGSCFHRVQCKCTRRHANSRRDGSPIWEVKLQHPHTNNGPFYHEESFDILYITTPGGDYMIPWQAFCAERMMCGPNGKPRKVSGVPVILRLGSSLDAYKLPSLIL